MDGNTPLICAANFGDVPVLDMLLAARSKDGEAADLNIVNNLGASALILAGETNNPP